LIQEKTGRQKNEKMERWKDRKIGRQQGRKQLEGVHKMSFKNDII
jgi:hypothetical protein